MAQSIAEIWAKKVSDKLKPVSLDTPVKPVKDDETENQKARFRQSILNENNKSKESM